MSFTRREFLRLGSTLLATSASVPMFLRQTALARALGEEKSDRVLVVVQLTGGNDGLNTVVPHTDPVYRKLRPKIQLADAKLHALNDTLGLNPGLVGFKALYDQGGAAVIQSVGYPNANRSHFESMAVWHAAPTDAQLQPGLSHRALRGWLARAVDQQAGQQQPSRAEAGDPLALRIGQGDMPQALLGSRIALPSIAELGDFKLQAGAMSDAQREALAATWQQPPAAQVNPLLTSAQAAFVAAHATANQIAKVAASQAGGDEARYPDNNLAARLRSVAQLIRAGLGTSIYYVEHGNFDTHTAQLNTHEFLLRQLGGALKAFLDDTAASAPSRPVLVLVFSEFGRRVEENAGAGTDHGTAAPVLLAGNGVVPGVHGPNPDLVNLVDGDPVFKVDLRSVYAAILENWCGVPSEPVLGQKFEPAAIVRPV